MSSRLVYTCDKCKNECSHVYYCKVAIAYPTHKDFQDYQTVESHKDLCENCLKCFGVVRRTKEEAPNTYRDKTIQEKLFDVVQEILGMNNQ